MTQKIGFLLLFLMLLNVSSLGALYNEKFRWKFSDDHQLVFAGANDSDGFKFTDFFDDVRTASLFFAYLAPKETPFFFEFSTNMHTYRGYLDSLDSERRRVDQADLFLSYYWFLPLSYEHKLTLSAGGRFSALGNLGGIGVQHAFHWVIGQKRPIVRTGWDPYRFIGYATGKIEYSWRDFVFVNADLHISPLGDFFVRGGVGLEFQNEFLAVEASAYVQQTHLQNLGRESSLWWTAQSENGVGLFYRLETAHYFMFRDIVLANWSPYSTRGQFFSVGGQGFTITLDAPERKRGEDTPKSPNTLSSSVGMRFAFQAPFNYSHSLLWVPRNYLPFTLSVGLATNEVYMYISSNRLFAHFLWDFFQHDFFGVFLETGASVSFDQWYLPSVEKQVNRPQYTSTGFSLSLEANVGLWFRLWHDHAHEYRLALFSGVSYAPLAVRFPYPNSSFKTRFEHKLWSPTWFGLAVEVRPFQPSLVRGKG